MNSWVSTNRRYVSIQETSCYCEKLKMVSRGFTARVLLLVSGCLLCVGCGGGGVKEPELAVVTGTILIDGKPEPDLDVVFEPFTEPNAVDAGKIGGSSMAKTDEEGHYELKYKGGDKKGAVAGKHVVRISRNMGGGPAGGETGAAGIPLPPVYNLESTLRAEVAAGENTKDFKDIKSQ